MNIHLRHLLLGGSALSMTLFAGTAALAQAVSNDSVEQVVVTGTSIRGVAPVGSNLISVTSQDIDNLGAQTIGQALLNVPAITGMGLIGQGQTNNSYYQPTIHQLGGSSSNATLLIFDGHRAVPGGTNHSNEVDPSVIPTAMIERVEVLTDGSSSVYGSDAVSGVINFITRKRFDGVQLNVQDGFLQGATDFTASALMGASAEHSSIIFAYQYTRDGAIADTDRPWTYPNHAADAAANGLSGPNTTNFLNFNCDPATIRPNASGSNYYPSPGATAAISNNQNNAFCSAWQNADLAPKEVRNDAMLKGSIDIGPNLTITSDLAYANLRDTARVSRGAVTATVFGTGAQANPFFQSPSGTTLTKEEIRWDADALLGPGATSTSGVDTTWGDLNAEYRIGDNFVVNFLASDGRTASFSNSDGTVNGAAAYLALNGSSQQGGSLTTPAIPGTNLISNAPLPLTTATALDVWDPASSNKTSPAVLAAITDNASRQTATFSYQQYRLSTNGTLFELPGGPVKVAVGIEEYRTGLVEFKANADGAGGATKLSNNNNLQFHQNVDSYYGEADIPIVGPDMAVPLVQKFDIDLSGRYDSYDTVGVTANPKMGFNWDVNDWLKLRGNTSTSFDAPVIDIRGVNGSGYYVGNTFGGTTNNIAVPVSAYPLVTQFGIPGCTAASTTCNISSLQGVVRRSGDGNVQPQKGRGYSLGFDFNPDFLPGFTAQMTYWHTTLIGGVTAPNINNVVVTGSMQNLITFTPGSNCASAAQVAALQGAIPLTSTIPSCVQYLFNDVNSNYLNLRIDGIDSSFGYRFDTDDYGSFRIVETATTFTRFKEAYAVGGAGAYYNVLNTTGANGSFPSVQTQSRTDLGWAFGDVNFDWYINFTSAYRNWNGSSLNPITFDGNNNPAGGGDHVHANITSDFHIAYDFQSAFGDDEISLSARNAFNQRPPFVNSSGGWDTWVANPLGRILTVGLKAKL
ncbi:MAG TPA: TonB-dependent receptor [Rhizomicrobium sp.]|nr:TonB-dependent receptor [Rhizomicrobium sp.]